MRYVKAARDEVLSELDQKLLDGFANSATETLSNIKAEDISTENTFHMEEYYTANSLLSNSRKKEKASLTFADFLGVNKIQEDPLAGPLANVAGMQEFSSMFQEDYDKMVEEGQLAGSGIDDLDEYLSQIMEIGEFDHKEYHPVLNVLSGLLDITIVKPLIETCVGYDLLTGEQLTDFERGMKVVFAIVDVATLGMALGATEIATLGTKEALMLAGKITVQSMASDAAAYTAGTLGNELGLPIPITLLISLGTGLKVSKTLDSITGSGKYVIKNDSGEVLGEIAEEALDNTKNLDNLLDGSDQTLEDLVKKVDGELDDLATNKNLDEVIDDSNVIKNSIDDVLDEADDSILGVKKGIPDADIPNASILDVNQNVILDDAIEDVAKNTTPDVNGGPVKTEVKDVIDSCSSTKIRIEETIPPNSAHSVKVYTDGNAQINTGKIDTYIRGKVKLDVDNVKARIEELKNIRKNSPSTFTKDMKEELKTCNQKLHNYQRSQEMSTTLSNAGIEDTIENNEMIAHNLLEAAKEFEAGHTEIISYIEGTKGKVQVVSRWKILKDRTPYLATIILKPVK